MKHLLVFFVFFALLAAPLQATVDLVTVSRGGWTIRLIYNETALQDSWFQMVRVNQTTQEIWFMAVWDTATSQYWGCRIESTRPIVVGPRGCSNTQDLAAALDSANCIGGEVEAEERLELFLQTWQLETYSAECDLEGGDQRLCVGPLRLSQDNRDSFIPLLTPTQADLLSARYFFVDSYLGPYCASPTTIQVPMKRPTLEVTMGTPECLGEDGVTFQGTYRVFGDDTYSDRIVDVWKAFQKESTPTFRLLLKRYGDPLSTSVDFKVYFAILEGSNDLNDYYSYWYETNETFTNLSPQGVFGGADWLQTLDLTGGTEYAFTQVPGPDTPAGNNTGNGTGVCSVTFTINSQTLYELDPVAPPGASDYYLNKFPRVEWKDRVCSIFYGRLDENLLEVLQYCPEGDKCGGFVMYSHPLYPNTPIYVPPDSSLQYRFDCDEFYPTNTTFEDYGGTERSRMDAARELCFAPFIVPDLIAAAVRPNERYLQCQKRGGYVFGRGRGLCAKPITTQNECRKGWVYFDQRCFYKFNPTTESSFLSALELANTACERLDSEAVSLVEVDQYTENWLLNEFIFYYKPDPDNTGSYRVPNPGSARGDCICYDTSTQTRTTCACQEEHFPICYYPIDAQSVVVPYQDVLVSLQTASVWQNGQVGPEFGGFQATCNCFPGWTGKNCERATCPLDRILVDPEFLAAMAIEQQETLTFFRRCYEDSRGACFNGQPRICQCNYGFGPSASLMPSQPLLYEFKAFPCVCPAGTGTSGMFGINEQVYNGTLQTVFLPCGGLDHGTCIAANTSSTLDAYCDSIDRENVNPSIPLTEDAVYDGRATTCMRPLQPWQGHTLNGPIVSNLCNSQGTCCPFGQSAANPLVGDRYAKPCFDRFGVPQEGCQCDLAWGGEACTCPVPLNLAEGRLQTPDDVLNAIVIDLGAVYKVTHVNVTSAFGVNQPSQGCGVGSVEISNEPGRSAESLTCTLNTTLQTVWNCQEFSPTSNLAYRFVVIYPLTTLTTDLSDCIVKAWEGPFYSFCGETSHVNSFAGRFYDIEAWRGVQFNLMPQFAYVASEGCTPSTCMCNSNWDGERCKWGASSIRQGENAETGQRTWFKALCGETVLVPTLQNPVRGRGVLGESGCECNSITNVDPTGKVGRTTERFTGEACECVDVYVQDLDDTVECAGHGECQTRDLPLGRCEVDYDAYLGDSLSEPFVRVTDFVDRDNTLTILETSYFIAPAQDTLAPTASPTTPTQAPTASPTFPPSPPTLSPTARPTDSPTTSPTRSPTFPTNPLVLYAGPRLEQGDLVGTSARSNLNAICGATPSNCPSNTACLFASISGSPVSTCWGALGVSVAAEIHGPTGTKIADNFADLSDGSLDASLLTAAVLPAGAADAFWWSGSSSALAFSTPNCNGWTSSSVVNQGRRGDRDSTTSTWINEGTIACNQQLATVCACKGEELTDTPTLSPTLSPTKAPTLRPTLSPTKSPTPPVTGERVVLYENTATDGFIQPTTSPTPDVRTNLNAFCTVSQPAQCSGGSFLFVSVVGSTAADVHTALGLPTAAPVVGPTDTEIATSNADLFDGSIAVTLEAAGVFSSFTVWWSSTDSDGTENINTCTSWTSAASTGGYGASDVTNFQWVDRDSFASCAGSFPTICACAAGLPTSSPTDPPSTGAPTLAPTVFSQPNPDLALYRATVGTEVVVNGALDSFNYCPNQILNEPPSRLGEFTPSADLVPIWWTNLYYLQWNLTSNSTRTETVSRCNPAYQAQPPGTAAEDGPCPFLDSCGSLATLDPGSWTNAPLAYAWPDLRGCVLNYTEEVRTDIGNLLANTPYTEVQIQCVPSASAASNKAITNSAISFGTIQCNSFIDRTINCALFLLVPAYELQCQQDPIGCFSFDVGKFFGGFDQQHPFVKFATVPRSRWEVTEQYKMIASVVNNYFYSIRGSPVDPLNQLTAWNDYIQTWINAADITTSTLELYSGNSRLKNATLVADLVQGRPMEYLAVAGEWQVTDVWGTSQESANQCVDGVTTACYGLTYTAVPVAPLKMPGLWLPIELDADTYVITVQINTRFTGVTQIKGVEVYNQNGGLCGSLMRELVLGETVFFSCVGTYGDQEVNGTLVWVRYLGPQPIWDIPQTILSVAASGGMPTDDVATVLQAGTDFTFDGAYNTVLTALYGAWNLIATTWTALFGLSQPGALSPTAWPQRQGTLSGIDLAGLAQYNLTVVSGAPIFSGATAWDNITDSIILNYTYPYNYPLANSLGSEWTLTPIDYTNQTHLDQLYYIWSTWLAPRQCGGDDSQCQQFGRGRCTFPLVDAFKQAWWQGEDPYQAPYTFQGNEGGCRCYNEFARGFWDNYQACRTCVDGYGPSTLAAWSRTLQYSQLLNSLFDATQFPFDQDFTGDPEKFWAEIACRLPYARDPVISSIQDIVLCAGHGNITTFELTNTSFVTKVFTDSFGRNLVPICESLSVSPYGSFTLALNDITDQQNLVYIGDDQMITAVNGALYVQNGTQVCDVQECAQRWPEPPLCSYDCGGQEVEVLCVNPNLFTTRSSAWLLGSAYVELSQVQSSVFLGWY